MKLVQLRTGHDQAGPAPQLHGKIASSVTYLSLTEETSCDLKRELEDATCSQISCRTLRRKLLMCGLKGRIAARKPLHSAVHQRKRLEWCQQRKDWMPEQWKKILFSDESIFELISGRRAFVRRRKEERFCNGTKLCS